MRLRENDERGRRKTREMSCPKDRESFKKEAEIKSVCATRMSWKKQMEMSFGMEDITALAGAELTQQGKGAQSKTVVGWEKLSGKEWKRACYTVKNDFSFKVVL